MREDLLSTFTAWNKRRVETTPIVARGQNPYVNVTVEAGYSSAGSIATSKVFVGQVVEVKPGRMPPDLSVQIECFTRQLDKTTRRTNPPPENSTFREYAQWVADQTNSPLICETSFNDSRNWNHSSATQWVYNLIIDLQDMYKPDIVAFYENGTLIVRDKDKVVSIADKVTVSEFIGTPMYTEYGMQFKALFDPRITLVSAVKLNSKMNPSLNGDYVLQTVEYELASREANFYVTGFGSPPSDDGPPT